MEDFSGIDFICVCFWAWSAYFRTGVIVRELHSDRILAGLDRARRQGKTLGRPKKVIDVENAEMQRRKGGRHPLPFGPVDEPIYPTNAPAVPQWTRRFAERIAWIGLGAGSCFTCYFGGVTSGLLM